MHSYSIGSSWVHPTVCPFQAQSSLHYLPLIRLCRRDALRWPHLLLAPPLLFFYSDSNMLVRYFYRSCGGPLVSPPPLVRRTVAVDGDDDVEWSLVCLFVCFAVRPRPTLTRHLPHGGPRWRTSHEELPSEHPSTHPSIHIRSTTSSFFPICTSFSFPTAFCQTF